jgi:hypothetical protein
MNTEKNHPAEKEWVDGMKHISLQVEDTPE